MKRSPLIFDGAMGTVIYDRGVFINTCYDELCLTNPKLILQIHRDYVEAGAEVIETNTFGANPLRLKPYGLAEKTEAINRAGVRLAREAAGTRSSSRARSVRAPSPGSGCRTRSPPRSRRRSGRRWGPSRRRGGPVPPGDLLPPERTPAGRAGGEGVRQPVLASFVLNDRGETALGMRAETMASALSGDDNVDIVGINCGTGPSGAFDALQAVLPHTGKPVVVMPNAGMPREISGRVMYLTSPEFHRVRQEVHRTGVRGVEGAAGRRRRTSGWRRAP